MATSSSHRVISVFAAPERCEASSRHFTTSSDVTTAFAAPARGAASSRHFTTSKRVTAAFAAAIMLAGCTTQMGRIGADDGSDGCRAQLVQLDSTGNFFGEDILAGAAVGALSGALIGGLATGRWQGALIGAAVGGAGGAAVGYYAAVQRQARDQQGVNAQIASDLAKENASLDRTQIAFDQLMDCRLRTAQDIREQVRRGQLDRNVATAQLAGVRQRVNGDLQLANLIGGRITNRGGQFDAAIDQVVPGGKGAVQIAGSPAPVRSPVRRAVAVTFSPQPNSPQIASIQQRDVVAVRPGPPGFAQVETSAGVRGYVPADAVQAAPRAAAEGGDVRSLAATNISRRENFTASVSGAERLAQAGGFELTS